MALGRPRTAPCATAPWRRLLNSGENSRPHKRRQKFDWDGAANELAIGDANATTTNATRVADFRREMS